VGEVFYACRKEASPSQARLDLVKNCRSPVPIHLWTVERDILIEGFVPGRELDNPKLAWIGYHEMNSTIFWKSSGYSHIFIEDV
jgi:hypothetical protein